MGKTELLEFYARARGFVQERYSAECAWQCGLDAEHYSESDLLREAAWVVLCSGFRESVVRAKFDYISLCFFDWESAELIQRNRQVCMRTASSAIANAAKIEAIVGIASRVAEARFERFRDAVRENPIHVLQELPFIGPITSYHLAKNLGFAVAKPDRHLARLARTAKMKSAHVLCAWIAGVTGDSVPFVDLVLWRYLASWPRPLASVGESTFE